MVFGIIFNVKGKTTLTGQNPGKYSCIVGVTSSGVPTTIYYNSGDSSSQFTVNISGYDYLFYVGNAVNQSTWFKIS